MKILGIIPARYASTRLEGKPLKDIEGKTMIRRVYEQAQKALENVVVATDDDRIFKEVQSFGGEVIMTSSNHSTGTNRCLEALEKYTLKNVDVVINIQGDEPLLDPIQIQNIAACFEDKSVQLASLAMPVNPAEKLIENQGCFVIMDKNMNALYFSRSVIPFLRDLPKDEWAQHHTYYKHLGMYAYTPEALKTFASLEQTSLEMAESLEQNRWLQNGYKLRMGITEINTLAVDTAEDLEKVRSIVRAL
jgi:3-deoxy-manno-octulosonate cytidylyltransferase (CMP-KDO synthetase)